MSPIASAEYPPIPSHAPLVHEQADAPPSHSTVKSGIGLPDARPELSASSAIEVRPGGDGIGHRRDARADLNRLGRGVPLVKSIHEVDPAEEKQDQNRQDDRDFDKRAAIFISSQLRNEQGHDRQPGPMNRS